VDCDETIRSFVPNFNPGCDLPIGWFCVGSLTDVPKGVHCGRYKDSCVWVPPYGEDGLANFTLTILSIATYVKPKSGEEKVSTALDDEGNRVLRSAPSAPEYIVPRVTPSIQFFPQAR